MDLAKWGEAVQALLDKLAAKPLSTYVPENNKFISPPNGDLLEAVEKLIEYDLPPQFKRFYKTFGGLALPDIWNGYFLYTLEFISQKHSNTYIPKEIAGNLKGNILTFGSDGGGNFYAIYASTAEVFFLRFGMVENGIFESNTQNAWVVAKDFNGFLEKLLLDIQAFAKDDKSWMYLDKLGG